MKLPPSEFWAMEPQELFWFVESNLPEPSEKTAVFDDTWRELAAMLD